MLYSIHTLLYKFSKYRHLNTLGAGDSFSISCCLLSYQEKCRSYSDFFRFFMLYEDHRGCMCNNPKEVCLEATKMGQEKLTV